MRKVSKNDEEKRPVKVLENRWKPRVVEPPKKAANGGNNTELNRISHNNYQKQLEENQNQNQNQNQTKEHQQNKGDYDNQQFSTSSTTQQANKGTNSSPEKQPNPAELVNNEYMNKVPWQFMPNQRQQKNQTKADSDWKNKKNEINQQQNNLLENLEGNNQRDKLKGGFPSDIIKNLNKKTNIDYLFQQFGNLKEPVTFTQGMGEKMSTHAPISSTDNEIEKKLASLQKVAPIQIGSNNKQATFQNVQIQDLETIEKTQGIKLDKTG